MDNFEEKLNEFLTQVRALSSDYTYEVEPIGKKYRRIISKHSKEHSGSLYCFVDTTNGNLLKGSWKSPVKNGVRGNIFEENTISKFSKHGPKYINYFANMTAN